VATTAETQRTSLARQMPDPCEQCSPNQPVGGEKARTTTGADACHRAGRAAVAPARIRSANLATMAQPTAEARQEILDALAEATDEIAARASRC